MKTKDIINKGWTFIYSEKTLVILRTYHIGLKCEKKHNYVKAVLLFSSREEIGKHFLKKSSEFSSTKISKNTSVDVIALIVLFFFI